MQIPTRVREGVQVLAEDALIVIGFSLAVVGIVELSGWSSKELLQGYTPLLLAMFSIIVTVSALRLSIKEGRDRALRERNDAVRPVLIAEAVDHNCREEYFGKDIKYEIKECHINNKNLPVRKINFSFENSGLGVALNIVIFVRCKNGEYYLSYYEIPKIAVGEKIYVEFHYSLPSEIDCVISQYDDIFNNLHYCKHELEISKYAIKDQRVIFNNYRDSLDVYEFDALDRACERRPITLLGYLNEGYIEN